MKVCFVTSEAHPFAKTGGLADVSSALARQLQRNGHDVRLFLPLYSRILDQARELFPVEFLRDVPIAAGGRTVTFTAFTTPLPGSKLWIYLIHCPALYDRPAIYSGDRDEHLRFAFLARAAIESCQRMGWGPDIFHCNDWHAALIPIYLKSVYGWDSLFRATRTVLTIHNLGYQGVFPAEVVPELGLAEHAHLLHQGDLRAGRIGFLRNGILHADALTTVSPTYAREIQTEEFGFGLHGDLRSRRRSLVGILNGVDYDEWSPETDALIPHRYSAERLEDKEHNKRALLEAAGLPYSPSRACLGVVSRLTHQKGLDLVLDVLPGLLGRLDLCFVALGAGERRYEESLERLARAFPGHARFYRGHNHALSHLIEAGADFFLMPSRYEPCGLNQMYSLRYGTVPVVRKTGGLADSVKLFQPATGEGTGIVFERFDPDAFRWALSFAASVYRDRTAWTKIRVNGMAQDFSWERQIRHYERLYLGLTGP